MARNDIKVYCPIEPEFTVTYIANAGSATSIKMGEPTKVASNGSVAIMVDGNGTTSERFAGIAKGDSTDTASAAGTVAVWLPLPGMVYSGVATTAANADTQAEIDALVTKRVVFDLTSTTWSVDTAATDAATNGLVIVGGDYRTSTIYFVVSVSCTVLE